jgi:hypothetical protein
MITAPRIQVAKPFAMPPFICWSVIPESRCHGLRKSSGEYHVAPTMTFTSTAIMNGNG